MTPVQYRIASWCLAAAALFLVLQFGLVAALLAGLLVHELVHIAARKLRLAGATHRTGKLIALGIVTLIVGLLVTAAVFGVIAFVSGGPLSVAALMQKMADVGRNRRRHSPRVAQAYFPADAAAWKARVYVAARACRRLATRPATSADVTYASPACRRWTVRAQRYAPRRRPRTTHSGGARRARMLAPRFGTSPSRRCASRRSIRLHRCYLAVVLPLFGVHLRSRRRSSRDLHRGPAAASRRPLSNTVVVIVSLGVSLYVAVASLAFLIVIHKLDYLLNARIIRSMIRAARVGTAARHASDGGTLGLAAVIVAPICCAYAKDELAARGAI